jgi:hypothetical protein
MEEFIQLYNSKWVQLSFTVSGYNQMDQTETQIISRVTFEGNKCNLSPISLIRSGHPCEQDAQEFTLTWIGDNKWERHRVEMEMEMKRDQEFSFEEDKWVEGDWILVRETLGDGHYMGGEQVDIELLDMKNDEIKQLLMPPPRARACGRQINSKQFKF